MTRGNGAAAGRVMRQHLADQEYLRPPAGYRFTDHLLRSTFAVHLGGVDERHAQVEPQTQGGNLFPAPVVPFAHTPRALTENRDGLARRQRDGTDAGG